MRTLLNMVTMAVVIRRATLPLIVAVSVAVAASCTSCSSTHDDDQRLVVAAALFPLAEIVQSIGGDVVSVVTIVPPGQEAHEYEPTPKQLTSLEHADIVLYLGDGFQPAVESVVNGLPDSIIKVDLLQGLTLLPLEHGNDPHVWLSPENMRKMATVVAATLTRARAAEAPAFDARAARYQSELSALHDDFTAGLADCASTFLVTGHEAFGYLAAEYHLTQKAISGISPGDEPSAKTLEEVSAFVTQHDVSTIFFEENLPGDLARTVAHETGASTAVLNTLETRSDAEAKAGDTYSSLMRGNLTALQTALSCS